MIHFVVMANSFNSVNLCTILVSENCILDSQTLPLHKIVFRMLLCLCTRCTTFIAAELISISLNLDVKSRHTPVELP